MRGAGRRASVVRGAAALHIHDVRLAATARPPQTGQRRRNRSSRGARAAPARARGRPVRAPRPHTPRACRAPHARPRAGVERCSARTHGSSAGGGRGAPERPSAWLGASAMWSGNPGAAAIRAAPVYITCQAQEGCLSKRQAGRSEARWGRRFSGVAGRARRARAPRRPVPQGSKGSSTGFRRRRRQRASRARAHREHRTTAVARIHLYQNREVRPADLFGGSVLHIIASPACRRPQIPK